MIDALRVAWKGLKDLWEEFVLLIMMNIIWSLLALLAIAPLLLLIESAPWLGLALSLVPLGLLLVATGAICYVTNQVARGNAISWRTFVTGVQRYWLKSLILAVINVIALILTASNILFYALMLQGTWTSLVTGIWVVIGIYWLVVQIYWFPMLLELKDEKILLSLRNALALPLLSPGFSLTLLLVLIILAILCIALTVPLALFMVALLLLIANRATRNRIEMVQQKHEAQQEKAAGER